MYFADSTASINLKSHKYSGLVISQITKFCFGFITEMQMFYSGGSVLTTNLEVTGLTLHLPSCTSLH